MMAKPLRGELSDTCMPISRNLVLSHAVAEVMHANSKRLDFNAVSTYAEPRIM